MPDLPEGSPYSECESGSFVTVSIPADVSGFPKVYPNTPADPADVGWCDPPASEPEGSGNTFSDDVLLRIRVDDSDATMLYRAVLLQDGFEFGPFETFFLTSSEHVTTAIRTDPDLSADRTMVVRTEVLSGSEWQQSSESEIFVRKLPLVDGVFTLEVTP